MSDSILILLMLLPLAFALFVAWMPEKLAPRIALIGTLLPALLGLWASWIFAWDLTGTMQFQNEVRWLPALGVSLKVGADGVSMVLLQLTLLLGPICILCSKTAIKDRLKTYYGWFLVLQAAMTGVFIARDLILFYICFEFTLIPMFILISLYGSTNRRKAAIKFFLYTFTGSIIALAGLVYVAWFASTRSPGGTWTFDLLTLMQYSREMPAATQAWVLGAVLLGFAVKVPLFPVHTWLPLAHTEAPTAGSVILAGVLLKLGTYGIYRIAIPFAPAAFVEFAPFIAGLSIVGILYGGLICWVQTDVKKLVAYSSVAHLGFCVLGLASCNEIGLSGAVLYMINHGLSTGALFLLIGMVYERYHTRDMAQLGGLAAKMPVWATFMIFFIMASVGLPGLNGFVSEVMCLLGAFQSSDGWGAGTWGSVASGTETFAGATPGVLGPWYAAIAGVGMVIAAMYLLKLAGSVVWGPLVEPHSHSNGHSNGHGHGHGHANGHGAGHGHDGHGHEAHGHAAADSHGELPTDLNGREIGILVPLAALCLFLGVYPKPLLHAIETPVAETAQLLRSTGGFNPAAPGGTERALVEADGATGEAKSDPVAAGTSMTESIGGLGQ